MQKTAYEMRISDWSSDVCSSDLRGPARHELLKIGDDGRHRRLLKHDLRHPDRIRIRAQIRSRRCSPGELPGVPVVPIQQSVRDVLDGHALPMAWVTNG